MTRILLESGFIVLLESGDAWLTEAGAQPDPAIYIGPGAADSLIVGPDNFAALYVGP